ncbi:carboxypeptidase-like regulatory domain-containing protein [Deinococcus sp.]|uniref:carboxypeptidase-like regulatory domain-containing protein n=1 Tax=Deinococcus sp. TaxID=47478 RepID=UPI003B5939D4
MKQNTQLLGIMGVLLLTACGASTPPGGAVVPSGSAQESGGNAQTQPPSFFATISGTVSVARSGEAVSKATVTADGTNASAVTNANGRYKLVVPQGAKNITITKPGFASTRVENIDTTKNQEINEIMQKAFDPDLPTTPPVVTTDLADGALVGDQDLKIGFKSDTASPDVNGLATGIVSLDVDAGSSGFLNAGRTRAVVSPTGDDSVTFKKSDFLPFSGALDVHISVYDFNGNRTHLIRHVKSASAIAAPIALAPTAITFADTGTFGALSVNPNSAALIKQWAKTHDARPIKQALSAQAIGSNTVGNTVKPQAAPAGTVMWIDVAFNYDAASPLPRAFELYRSLDGANYTKVLTAAPSKVLVDPTKPELGYVIRDNSAQLTPGVQTYYKVRAVGESQAEDSERTSVVPLGRYSVTLEGPAQAATGVETIPIFRWHTTGASDVEEAALLLLDRTQAEGSVSQWQSDVSGKANVIYNADGRASTPSLQPYHAYDWQLAAITYNKDNTAYSIGADFFNVFGVTAFPVEAGPINEFVTGGK